MQNARFTGSTIAISDGNDPWARPAQLAAIQAGDTVVFTDRSGPPTLNFVGGQNNAIRNASIYSAGRSASISGGLTAQQWITSR